MLTWQILHAAVGQAGRGVAEQGSSGAILCSPSRNRAGNLGRESGVGGDGRESESGVLCAPSSQMVCDGGGREGWQLCRESLHSACNKIECDFLESAEMEEEGTDSSGKWD